MILTQDDLKLLKELKAAGERGKNVSALEANPMLVRLLKGGYVVDRATELDSMNYRITRRGLHAIAAVEWWSRTSIAPPVQG
jgi:hypothetical protein